MNQNKSPTVVDDAATRGESEGAGAAFGGAGGGRSLDGRVHPASGSPAVRSVRRELQGQASVGCRRRTEMEAGTNSNDSPTVDDDAAATRGESKGARAGQSGLGSPDGGR